MFVKEFAESVASIAAEIHCDGGRGIASHRIPSSVTVELVTDPPPASDATDDAADGPSEPFANTPWQEAEFELVDLDVERLLGCGCWCGIRLRIRRVA